MNKEIIFDTIFSSNKLINICEPFYQCILITDKNVGALYSEKIKHYFAKQQKYIHVITIPAGERSKSREMKASIEDEMLKLNCGRDTCVIALGGGVVCDLAGFVAATYCRGVPAIYIPTSLLAMVDASIGGKTGVNTRHGKNLIGTFTQPKAVFIDIAFLTSLPEIEYSSAFSEIIKHALIYDFDYFEFIEQNLGKLKSRNAPTLEQVIKRSCEIKSTIVNDDEHEKSKREILNFGHTIAHALELVNEYKMSHGHAVAIGLVIESYISLRLNMLSFDEFKRIEALLLVIFPARQLFEMNFKTSLKADKKSRENRPRFVLLKKIGVIASENENYSRNVSDELIDAALEHLLNLYGEKNVCSDNL